MQKEKQAKVKSKLSAVVLQGYEVVFLRKHLGMERVVPDLGKERGEYITKVLSPILEGIDEKVNALREASALRLPSGQFKTNDLGEIQYGTPEQTHAIREQFAEIIKGDIIIPIENQTIFLNMRDIWRNLKQELNEEDTGMYLQVLEKLNSVEIETVKI